MYQLTIQIDVMKSKWPLYLGIFLLTIGIVLRVATHFDPWSLIILLTGVAFKIAFILSKIISKEYKVGYEIGHLIVVL